MPDKRTIERARADRRAGKSPSTQAGEFVHEEIDKIRHGKHGARSARQAIAIGLSEARRAGVDLPPPKRGRTSERTRKSAQYAYEAGHGKHKTHRRPRVSRAVSRAKRSGTVSRAAFSRQGRRAAARRTKRQRSATARKAAHPLHYDADYAHAKGLIDFGIGRDFGLGYTHAMWTLGIRVADLRSKLNVTANIATVGPTPSPTTITA